MKVAASVLGVMLMNASTEAGMVALTAVDRGWYQDNGFHLPDNDNYAVGNAGQDHITVRNWFVFDLSVIDTEIVAVTLLLFNRRTVTNDLSETWEVYDVETDIDSLMSGTGGVAAYEDLGSGTLYASREMFPDEAEVFISVSLNAAAVADANAAAGLWAAGGTIATLDRDPTTHEGAFFNSGDYPLHTQLIVTFIPSPGVLALFGLAALYGPRPRGR